MIGDAARLLEVFEGTVSHGLSTPIAFSDRTRARVEVGIRTLDDRLSQTARVLTSPCAGMARNPLSAHPVTGEPCHPLGKFTAASDCNVTLALQLLASHP